MAMARRRCLLFVAWMDVRTTPVNRAVSWAVRIVSIDIINPHSRCTRRLTFLHVQVCRVCYATWRKWRWGGVCAADGPNSLKHSERLGAGLGSEAAVAADFELQNVICCQKSRSRLLAAHAPAHAHACRRAAASICSVNPANDAPNTTWNDFGRLRLPGHLGLRPAITPHCRQLC